MGGLIGGHDFLQYSSRFYATGDVIGRTNVGGFIGAIHPYAIEVARNYSTGHVTGIEAVGGFVGNAGSLTIKTVMGWGMSLENPMSIISV